MELGSPDATVVPLNRLDEFETFDSIPFLMGRAAEMASVPDNSNDVRLTPQIPVSTSFMFFAFTESVNTEGRWTAHLLREFLDQHSTTYTTTRDHYFRRKGSLGLQAQTKGSGKARRAENMTGYLFAALGRSRDIAQQTTGQQRIHARHLATALLQEDSAKERSATDRSGVLTRLSEMGIEPGALRAALFDHVCNKGDDDTSWAALLLESAPFTRRLAGFSTDRVGGKDLLSIESDVLSLSALIAARTIEPPLSIGLFGEWGSGKTFFMRELRSAIDRLALEARGENRMQRELPFYKNIVQIEFNAWHYVEGNLWASLVEHILDNLYPKEDPRVSRALQETLIKRLAEEKALAQATNTAVDSAKAAAAEAKQELVSAQGELDKKTLELATLNAKQAGRDFILTGAHEPILHALDQLGFGKVEQSAVELEGALRQIHAVLGRGQRFLAPLTRAKDRDRRFIWLLFSLLGAPVVAIVVRAILQSWDSPASDTYAYLTGVAALIASGVPWLKQQADWMSKRLDEAEKAQKAFDQEMAKETAEHVRKVTEAEQKLRELTAALDSALRRHAEAKGREATADAELKAATTGRLLANFITDRAASSDYRRHLGVLALVRDDFEKLSGLIEEENWRLAPDDPDESPRPAAWPAKFTSLTEEDQDKDKRINRIVLYIDDLDRCPPNKVVEVLQAVHLLLAFPLFVVIVGVDARWITRSLQTKYRELLLVGGKPSNSDDEAKLLIGSATPNDYLEKIFQIPFWLKPMDATASDRMVRGVLRASVARADRDSPGSVPANSTGGDVPIATGGGTTAIGSGTEDSVTAEPSDTSGAPSAAGQQTSSTTAATTAGDAPQRARRTVITTQAKVSLESLEIVTIELDYITKLAPVLGRSPRALKRFANVYRLIKVGLAPHEQRAFLIDRSPLSSYQAVLFLLAVDTGAPMVARSFFAAIDRGARSLDGGQKLGQAAKPRDLEWVVKELDEEKTLDDPAGWQRLREWLMSPKNDAVPLATELPVLSAWSRKVGRYSFEVGRA